MAALWKLISWRQLPLLAGQRPHNAVAQCASRERALIDPEPPVANGCFRAR